MTKGPLRGLFVGLLIRKILVLSCKAQGRRVSGSEALRFATSPEPRRPPVLLGYWFTSGEDARRLLHPG